MAKRRRRRGLGSPPEVHASEGIQHAHTASRKADEAAKYARAGHCGSASIRLVDAARYLGAADMSSAASQGDDVVQRQADRARKRIFSATNEIEKHCFCPRR